MLEPVYCLNEGSDSPKLTHLSLAEVTAPQEGDYKSSNQWKGNEGSFNLILRYVISFVFFFFTSAMPKFSQFFSPKKEHGSSFALAILLAKIRWGNWSSSETQHRRQRDAFWQLLVWSISKSPQDRKSFCQSCKRRFTVWTNIMLWNI